ncbi:MAG: response regulator [Pseudomonadota bacterium]
MHDVEFSELSFVVAEDGAYMRSIIRTMLQGFGCRQIHEAEDGAAALELVERVMPDIVLLDWVMPVLDGSDVMRMIRQPSHPMAYVPVIMITAHTERKRIVEARQLGVHEVLCKPLSAKAVYQRIRSVILQPRPFVNESGYFGPEPREMISNRTTATAALAAKAKAKSGQ